MMLTKKSPILVTGAHRSGTTWIGKMLASSPEVTYISEPLNVWHRPGVLRAATKYWYTYICEQNQAEFLSAFQETLWFRYHLWLELKSLRSAKDIARMFRDFGWFLNGRIRQARALLKDPFAVFSAPWFAEQLGCQVVISVRHPLAFVSSLKRLGWDFDLRDFLAQPLLMRDYLEPFRDEMEKTIAGPQDVIVQGSLLWRMVYSVVDGFRVSYPDFILVRHEDLSRQSVDGYRALYGALGLDFTSKVQQALIDSIKSSNPAEVSKQRVHTVKLDSQANLSNWRKRLEDTEVHRIRSLTADVAQKFYADESWE